MKISANDSPTTALTPQRAIACGACSRDDPQPKFALTSRTPAPWRDRIVEGMDDAARGRFAALVLEDVTFEAGERNGLEEPGRNDAIRVDVIAANDDGPARDLGDANDGVAHARTSPRTSTTSPATAAAATIAGLISSVRPVGLP